jgi:uncharacterized protein with gpF-like domain
MPKLIIDGPRPSAAIRAQYSRALLALLREMFADIDAEIKAGYGRLASEYAADAKPKSFFDHLKETFKKWDKKFDKFAGAAARWFAKKTNASTTARLAGAMKEAGLTVKFKPSPQVAAMVNDIVAANVGLIKTIPKDLMTRVNDIVLESTLKGRDMGAITKEIRKGYGITERRAIMIARDQTNKVTEAIGRARVQEIGVTHGFWMHRSGGKVPRETHIGIMNGQRFPLADGLFDPQAEKIKGGDYIGRMVQPGELVNCHCTFKLDLSTIGGAGDVAMDAKRGTARLNLPGAVITWGADA